MPLFVINTLYNIKMFILKKQKSKISKLVMTFTLVSYWVDMQPLKSTIIDFGLQ